MKIRISVFGYLSINLAIAFMLLLPGACLGLDCVDYANTLERLALVDLDIRFQDLAVEGDIAYVSSVMPDLYVVDISDPFDPHVLGSFDAPYDPIHCFVPHGAHGFAGYDNHELAVFDLSDPTSPGIITLIPMAETVRALKIVGNILYVAMHGAGIEILDISEPSAPVSLGLFPWSGLCLEMEVAGGLLFAAHSSVGILIIDVSDPTAPFLVSECSEAGDVEDIWVAENIVYLGCRHDYGFSTMDVSNPAAPVILANLELDAELIWVMGDLAVAVGGAGLVRTIDVSDPAAPTVIGMGDVASTPEGIFFRDDILFVSAGYYGLDLIDLSDPATVHVLDQLDLWGFGDGVAKQGDFVFAAMGYGGFDVIDVSDPFDLVSYGSLDMYREVRDIALRGDYAYVANNEAGLAVIDISDPANPVQVATANAGSGISIGVGLHGDLALVAKATEGLLIIDIADPVNPDVLAQVGGLGSIFAVEGSGDHAFAASYSQGLVVLDIADPSAPVVVTAAGSCARALLIDGDLVYLLGWDGEFEVLDISVPTAPVLISWPLQLPADGLDLSLAGELLYVGGGNGGVMVLDLSDPTQPELVVCLASVSANALLEDEGIVYILARYGGLGTLPPHCDSVTDVTEQPGRRFLSCNYPNPFNPSTTIAFQLPSTREVSLSVFDLAGRRVSRILDGAQLDAGAQQMTWHARDEAGRALPSGVYFYRLEAGDLSESRAMILIK